MLSKLSDLGCGMSRSAILLGSYVGSLFLPHIPSESFYMIADFKARIVADFNTMNNVFDFFTQAGENWQTPETSS